jgi:hypothetical protein
MPAVKLPALRSARFEAENCFAFFHQIETIARKRFQIDRVRFDQIHFASLSGEQNLLIVHEGLQSINIGTALLQFVIRRNKKADGDEPDGDEKKDAQNAIQSLPDGGFATFSKIAVARVIH